MKVYFNRFAAEVKKKPMCCYLVTGEEPWQSLTACDIIRSRAKKDGYMRQLFFSGVGFDPSSIMREANSGSLFGDERKLLDLRIESQATKGLSDVIKMYVDEPPDGVILLIQATKVDARKAWVKSIANSDNAMMVTVYNKTGTEFRQWLKEVIRAKKLVFDADAEELLAMRVDGNLPAAENALNTMKLAQGEADTARAISVETISSIIGDSSRFSVYDLVDAAIVGDTRRATHVLYSLKEDNVALPLLLWALQYKLKILCDGGSAQGSQSSRRAMSIAMKRKLSWQSLLHRCAEVDETVKSVEVSQAWNSIFNLVFRICGHRLEY